MPTYQYECAHCGHNFEIFQKISDKPLENCPKCNQKVRRLISGGSGIIFKGHGFYATDYRSKAYKERQKEEAKSAAPTCPVSGDNAVCKHCPTNKDA